MGRSRWFGPSAAGCPGGPGVLQPRENVVAMVGEVSPSRDLAVVVSQHSAEPLAAGDLAVVSTDLLTGLNQFVVQSLVVALAMEMFEEGRHGFAQRVLTKENHPVEGFLLKGSVEPLQMGVQIGALGRQNNRLDT